VEEADGRAIREPNKEAIEETPAKNASTASFTH